MSSLGSMFIDSQWEDRAYCWQDDGGAWHIGRPAFIEHGDMPLGRNCEYPTFPSPLSMCSIRATIGVLPVRVVLMRHQLSGELEWIDYRRLKPYPQEPIEEPGEEKIKAGDRRYFPYPLYWCEAVRERNGRVEAEKLIGFRDEISMPLAEWRKGKLTDPHGEVLRERQVGFPMKASELIALLQNLMEHHGDLPVAIWGEHWVGTERADVSVGKCPDSERNEKFIIIEP